MSKDINMVCLDLEGVLVPEIWIAFSEATNIPELKITTREEPDYDKLMKYRIGILKEHGFKNILVTNAGGTITSHCGENYKKKNYINDGNHE